MRTPATLAILLTLALPATAQQTRTVTDDLGRSVTIPAAPQRIAALDDLRLTVPLLELGAPLIASHGREGDDGTPYIRSALLLTGADFASTDLAYLGNEPLDIEALAAAAPDLIVTLTSRDPDLDSLTAIAPTVVFAEDQTDRFAIYDRLADLSGTQPTLARLQARYAAELADLARLLPDPRPSVSVIEAGDGGIAVAHSYGSLGRVLRDAGFARPAAVDAIPAGGERVFSAELLADLDADIVIDSYRNDRAEGPADADARMQAVLPGYCALLRACRDGRYYRIGRDQAYAISYQSLSVMTALLGALTIAGSGAGPDQ